MCGILGFIGKKPVAERLITGSDRLQNRGEHSTGAATYDGNFFYSHLGLGPAALVFNDYPYENLKGSAGIAHTRYATTGGDSPEKLQRNIQPVYADRPGMFTCANGDLINMLSQTERLKEMGFSFQTELDSKVLQNLMIHYMHENKLHCAKEPGDYVERIFKSLEDLHKDLQGAYSVVTLMETGLLVFKDPHGIRPLSMAKRTENGEITEYAFSSESAVFNYFGDYSDIEELKPGEALFIEHNTLKMHRRQITPMQEAFCFFEFVYFSRPDTKFKDRVVENVRKNMGGVLAEEFASMRNRIDVVVGIPATGLSAAHNFGQILNIPYENAIIKVGNKRSFQETSDEKRRKAIDNKFIFIKDFIEGKRIAVIDDSNVRGTTAKKIARRLYDLGAKEVHYFFFSPPIIGSCYYGIDTPDESKLIAVGNSNEEIRKLMQVDSVNYISHQGLIRGLGIPKEELCLACITKKYPTPVDEIHKRLELRKKERGCGIC